MQSRSDYKQKHNNDPLGSITCPTTSSDTIAMVIVDTYTMTELSVRRKIDILNEVSAYLTVQPSALKITYYNILVTKAHTLLLSGPDHPNPRDGLVVYVSMTIGCGDVLPEWLPILEQLEHVILDSGLSRVGVTALEWQVGVIRPVTPRDRRRVTHLQSTPLVSAERPQRVDTPSPEQHQRVDPIQKQHNAVDKYQVDEQINPMWGFGEGRKQFEKRPVTKSKNKNRKQKRLALRNTRRWRRRLRKRNDKRRRKKEERRLQRLWKLIPTEPSDKIGDKEFNEVTNHKQTLYHTNKQTHEPEEEPELEAAPLVRDYDIISKSTPLLSEATIQHITSTYVSTPTYQMQDETYPTPLVVPEHSYETLTASPHHLNTEHALSSLFPRTYASTTHSTTTNVPSVNEQEIFNYGPIVLNGINRLEVEVGDILDFQVPKNTFYDHEDGDATHMNLRLLTHGGTEIPPTSWIKYNQHTRQLYAMPLPEDVGTHNFILSATDSGGKSIYEVFEVVIRTRKNMWRINHEFSVSLDLEYQQFLKDVDQRIDVTKRLAGVYGDNDARNIRVTKVEKGSVIISWTNKTIAQSWCPIREISRLVDILMTQDNAASSSLLSHMKPYKVLYVNAKCTGTCQDGEQKNTEDIVSLNNIYNHSYFYTLIICLSTFLVWSSVSRTLHKTVMLILNCLLIGLIR